jgi:hypothetical protein
VFRENAWRSLEPVQQGLLIGLGIGVLVAVFTESLSWIAIGVGVGVAIGHHIGRRRTRTQNSTRTQEATMSNPPRRRPAPKVLTEEERESSVRQSAWYNGGRMAEGKTDRAGALEHMRNTVPGFPAERYETELDDALAGIEEAKVRVVARRAKDVAEVRKLDMLNAVFALHYFNRRFSRHVGEYGLGPIDLVEALGDLFTSEQIDEAVRRSNVLIEEGLRMGIGPMDILADMDRLRAAHPGFRDQALSEAVDWGYLMHR